MAGYSLSKTQIKALVEMASGLEEKYGKKDEANGHFTYFGERFSSTDELALRLLERSHGVLVTGISLRGHDFKIRTTVGLLQNDGTLFPGTDTLDFRLEDFSNGTTMMRFGLAVCDVVESRTQNSNPGLKNIMMPNAVAYATRTRGEINTYIDPQYRSGSTRKVNHPHR